MTDEKITLTPAPDESYMLRTLDYTPDGGETVIITLNENGVYSFVMPDADVTVNAAFRKAPSEPEFVGHQMVLSGQLSLHFYMSIPEGMTDGTLDFFVGKWSVTSDKALQSDGRYRFTCFINSVEMAEMITAVYTYKADGVKKTVTDVISVQDYLEYIISNRDGLAAYTAAAPLAKALYNYGHYAGYAVPDGEKHPKMPGIYAAEAGLIGSLSGFGLKAALGGDITAAAFSLDLDCETALNFYLKTDTELSEQNVSVTADDGSSPEYTVARAGTRWHIQVTGIGAHKLGTVYTMIAGYTSISASAMTYVQQCLSNTSAPEKAKRVAAALYEYYQQAVRYIMTSDIYKQRGLEAYIIPIETFDDDGEIPEDNTGE